MASVESFGSLDEAIATANMDDVEETGSEAWRRRNRYPESAMRQYADIKQFFQKTVPRNRLKQKFDEIQEARLTAHEAKVSEAEWNIAFNRDMAELDQLLYEGEAVYDPEAEFANDPDQWLQLFEDETGMDIGYQPLDRDPKKRGGDTLWDEDEAAREIGDWIEDHTGRYRKLPKYFGYQPNTMGVGDHVYEGASVAEGVNIPGVNIAPVGDAPVPASYDGVPVGGPLIPESFGDVEMVEVEVPPTGVVIDVAAPRGGGDTVPVAVQNPFSAESLTELLQNTIQNPFIKRKARRKR